MYMKRVLPYFMIVFLLVSLTACEQNKIMNDNLPDNTIETQVTTMKTTSYSTTNTLVFATTATAPSMMTESLNTTVYTKDYMLSTTESTKTINITGNIGNHSTTVPTLLEDRDETTSTSVTIPTEIVKENIPIGNTYHLIVDGTEVATKTMYLHESNNCAMLPFITVMKALGATIVCEDAADVKIEFKGKEYTLSTLEKQLVPSGASVNYIIPTPGSKVFCEVVGNEFLLDHITLKTTLLMMGMSATINIDYDTYTVTICSK